MKKIAIIFAIILLSIPQCHKGVNEPPDGNDMQGGIRIKGKIGSLQKTSGAQSLEDAKRVLVFSKYYYSLSDIKNDSFVVSAQFGTGAALIFLDAENKYIGHLSAHGLNLLPLGNLAEGDNTVIDLSSLTMTNGVVLPSHDPIGNEIQINETELQSMKMMGSYYESIAKNIDADNDGIPDVLSNKQLVVSTMYAINAGHWGCNDTLPALNDSSHYYVNYGLEIGGGSELTFNYNDIVFSGPAGDPYSDIVLWGYMKAPQCGGNRAFIASFSRLGQAPPDAPWGTAFLPFKNGLYTVTLDAERNYTLNYSNIDVQYNLVIISPTLHTNSAGRLTSITLTYALPDGTPVNPASVLTNVMLQCSDNMAHIMFENSGKLTTTTGFTSVVVDPPMNITTMRSIGIGYDDMVGNSYNIIWN